jgi:hypothetical protein
MAELLLEEGGSRKWNCKRSSKLKIINHQSSIINHQSALINQSKNVSLPPLIGHCGRDAHSP